VVARVLLPADYGLVGMSGFLVGMMQMLSEFGLSAAVLRMRDLPPRSLRQLHAAAILLGFVGAAITSLLAIPLAAFFGEPRLLLIVPCASLGFIAASIATVPNALLQRELAFKRISAAELGGMAVMALATLGLALAGARYWALVFGPLAGTLAASLLQLRWKPVGLARPRRADVGGVMRFTGAVVGGQLTWYLYSNADNAAVGRVLGPAALGSYSIAWALAFVPVEQTNTIISRIAGGFFTGLQHDVPRARQLFVRLTEGVAAVTMPASFGLAVVSPALVRTVLGPKWEAAILPLALLSAFAAFRSLTLLYAPMIVAFGEPMKQLKYNLWTLATLLVAFFLAARFGGAPVVAASWMLFLLVQGWPLLRYVRGLLALPMRDYLRALQPGLVGSLVMVPGTWLIGTVLAGHVPPLVTLVAQVGAGAGLYVATIVFLYRERLSMLRSFVSALRNR
jgi:O-antigen/teichoic acid export membrane protein